ncbi:MAG: HlyD family efflux transporter periplasmic adaptor subunit [Alphaproteobacteria bacterium]|nr:HlyD family efflux transporter periplasmic adaptor subunit [Alphaproteobacteria bacterium]
MDKALLLLDLQKQALTVKNIDALGFMLVNKTHALVPYTQAVFWTGDERVKLQAASGGVTLDTQSPYAHWLSEAIQAAVKDGHDEVKELDAATLEGCPDHTAPHILLMPLATEVEGVLGGLWLERDKPFHEAEKTILNELADVYGAALLLQNLRRSRMISLSLFSLKKYRKWIVAGLVLAALCPVRLSMTAPAEIVGKNPGIVSVPFEGMMESIPVRPGEQVVQDQVVAIMERQAHEARMRAAEQELKIAEASLARLRREALLAPEKKAQLEQLQSDIALKTIEYNYARDMLSRAEIKAPQSGVAIFSDPASLIGKPVSMGEAVMQIADPAESELLIRIPVDSLLPMTEESPVTFYMNTAPLSGYDAGINSIGYQASPDADGLLTYKVRATLPDGYDGRIGWQGTARIYGNWNILAYALLRRPLITLRNITGV